MKTKYSIWSMLYIQCCGILNCQKIQDQKERKNAQEINICGFGSKTIKLKQTELLLVLNVIIVQILWSREAFIVFICVVIVEQSSLMY